MVLVVTIIKTEQNMKETGRMISSMDLELNNGMITQSMRVIISKEKNTAKVYIHGLIPHITMVTGKIIK